MKKKEHRKETMIKRFREASVYHCVAFAVSFAAKEKKMIPGVAD